MTESASVVAWGWEWEEGGGLQKGTKKALGVMEMFVILIVVMVSRVNTYVKTNPNVYCIF